jgi:beta-phosphoglucomutase-like phosphatase (HAD superfamily)
LQIKVPELQNSEVRHRAKHLKSKFYSKLIDSNEVQFKPGVESIIKSMVKKSVPIYVVTSSTMEEINIISKRFPLLKNIEAWFTRESYSKRKPDPECYIKAITHFEQDQRIDNPVVIGFEDTPTGLLALQDSKRVNTAVLVTSVEYPDRDELLKRTSGETIWCKSFSDVPMAWA